MARVPWHQQDYLLQFEEVYGLGKAFEKDRVYTRSECNITYEGIFLFSFRNGSARRRPVGGLLKDEGSRADLHPAAPGGL